VIAMQLLSAAPDLLGRVDFFRLDATRRQDRGRKETLGQFLTPTPVARLMAAMLECRQSHVHILDAGAGVGSLLAACVSELCHRQARPATLSVVAYEIDPILGEYLPDTLNLCREECHRAGIQFAGEFRRDDFIENAVEMLTDDLFTAPTHPGFNCAILNPPYRKIRAESETRHLLRRIGIEANNLYTAFLSAAVQLLKPSGELVAITPRSFCNGPYFRGFREFFLRRMILRRLHVFASRQQAFSDDDVLQENVILHSVKGTTGGSHILITESMGPDDEEMLSRETRYDQVVHPGDPQSFIHIVPDDVGRQVAERMAHLETSLTDLGLSVSTGRVVDFRARDYLRPDPEDGTAPLIYPTHLHHGSVAWPKPGSKKPNALAIADRTRDLLVPKENYVLVRRFSAKEERRRVVASVFDASCIPGTVVGFENHLNYFHRSGRGLDLTLVRGLAAFLNSTLVDSYFRQFNGHTQVNATDLRSIRYPRLDQLISLGLRIPAEFPDQLELDRIVETELSYMAEPPKDDPIRAKRRTEEALGILKDLGFPRPQLNERSALTLLALLGLKPDTPWSEANDPLWGVAPMMEFFAEHYGKTYKTGTRETVRRQTIHQFLDAGLIVVNPDAPERPVNSPKFAYRIERSALELLKTFGTKTWKKNLRAYLASTETLKKRYAREREMARIPIQVRPDKTITLSPGGQNVLVKQIIEEFVSRFTPGGRLLYIGDADLKFAYFDEEGLTALGVRIEAHGKMPDVVVYHTDKNWLVLIEAVTSHGPVDPKRRRELDRLFGAARAGLVFVTAFLTRKAMVEYLNEISWETEVWVAESPTHLIHFNGERFLGPS
jgi:adenine-specific DNA-methyltransferase